MILEEFVLHLFLDHQKNNTPHFIDFSSISFISRQYSRIREESAGSGLYFIMVEALTDVRNLTLAVSLLPPSGHFEKRENLLRISSDSSQWATRGSVP